MFTIKITGPNGYVNNIQLLNGQTKSFADFTDVGTYTVEEAVDANKHSVKYLINGEEKNQFVIVQGQNVLAAGNHINITVENTRLYKVTHEFVSGTTGKELPKEVKDLLPKDQKGIKDGTFVTPTQPKANEVKVKGGKWIFKSYDRANDTIEGKDENFVGTWVFVEEKYKVTYEFVSGTPGKDLPDEVKALIAEAQENLDDGTDVTAIRPKVTEVAVNGGKWVFKSYDKDNSRINGADERFVGVWVFVEDKPTTTPTTTTSSNTSVGTPKTGDGNPIILWVVLMLVSGGLTVWTFVSRRKRERQ